MKLIYYVIHQQFTDPLAQLDLAEVELVPMQVQQQSESRSPVVPQLQMLPSSGSSVSIYLWCG